MVMKEIMSGFLRSLISAMKILMEDGWLKN